MTPEAHNIQFSRQIWQAVSQQANGCLLRRDFCPEQSRVENLRCADFLQETEQSFAIGVDPVGRRHVLHGALEFSIQYGLLEPAQAAMFEDEDARDKSIAPPAYEYTGFFPRSMNRRFWLGTVTALFGVLAAVWTVVLISILRS